VRRLERQSADRLPGEYEPEAEERELDSSDTEQDIGFHKQVFPSKSTTRIGSPAFFASDYILA
jgi:hypothetical protein